MGRRPAKVDGVWKPILDADEFHRDAKNPWALQAASTSRSGLTSGYSKLSRRSRLLKTRSTPRSTSRASSPTSTEAEGPLTCSSKGRRRLQAHGEQAVTRLVGRPVGRRRVLSPGDGEGPGVAVTYFHDETTPSGGQVAAVRGVRGRLVDITGSTGRFSTRSPPISRASWETSTARSPSLNFLFDATKAMPTASKMFDG